MKFITRVLRIMILPILIVFVITLLIHVWVFIVFGKIYQFDFNVKVTPRGLTNEKS